MRSDWEPVLFSTPREMKEAEIYFIHDLHRGCALHDSDKWVRVKAEILSGENRFVLFLGDAEKNVEGG